MVPVFLWFYHYDPIPLIMEDRDPFVRKGGAREEGRKPVGSGRRK